MLKRIALAALAAVAGIGAAAGLAGPSQAAEATTYPGMIKDFTTSHVSPSNETGVVHTGLEKGERVDIHCFREGQQLDGNGYWFVIEKSGDAGYVHATMIHAPNTVPHC